MTSGDWEVEVCLTICENLQRNDVHTENSKTSPCWRGKICKRRKNMGGEENEREERSEGTSCDFSPTSRSPLTYNVQLLWDQITRAWEPPPPPPPPAPPPSPPLHSFSHLLPFVFHGTHCALLSLLLSFHLHFCPLPRPSLFLTISLPRPSLPLPRSISLSFSLFFVLLVYDLRRLAKVKLVTKAHP
jgi:hypothetical protein